MICEFVGGPFDGERREIWNADRQTYSEPKVYDQGGYRLYRYLRAVERKTGKRFMLFDGED
jgi:hypothetical protein